MSTPARRDRRAMLRRRECYLCGRRLAEGGAVAWPRLLVLLCPEPCTQVVRAAARDYSRSRRGRWRSIAEHLMELERLRGPRHRLVVPPPGVHCWAPSRGTA